jgi:hypothetical protein
MGARPQGTVRIHGAVCSGNPVAWARNFMSAATLALCTLVLSFGKIQPFCNPICGKTLSASHRLKGIKLEVRIVAHTGPIL